MLLTLLTLNNQSVKCSRHTEWTLERNGPEAQERPNGCTRRQAPVGSSKVSFAKSTVARLRELLSKTLVNKMYFDSSLLSDDNTVLN